MNNVIRYETAPLSLDTPGHIVYARVLGEMKCDSDLFGDNILVIKCSAGHQGVVYLYQLKEDFPYHEIVNIGSFPKLKLAIELGMF
jgi:hypothetical protein